ncbi:MAG: CPBP family intramembrane glutamic endopeptidase, partial [Phycisphaerae bacterium]
LVPWLLLTEIVVGQISGHLRQGHPPVHPLLEAMGKHPPLPAQILLVVAAVVIAPIAEEIIFRGLLQTTLLGWGRKTSAAPAAGTPLASPTEVVRVTDVGAEADVIPAPVDVPQEYADQPVVEPEAPSATRRWIVILVASTLFAAVHFNGDNYEAPPIIFVLAIALGYIYERTGNLWASIALHAAFNGVSTTLFLLGKG